MHNITDYQHYFSTYLNTKKQPRNPRNLYDPINYMLSLGGKRLRPVLVLMSTEVFGTSYKYALDAALAIEVFHNFTLVHDDIMDDAPLRRGKQTVHEKWDIKTGILSGDTMLIHSYQLFENYEGQVFKELVSLFSKTAIEVCEGQQYDVDFETRDDVTIPEYLKMIEYKTAVLVGSAMKTGAILAGASVQEQEKIYDFGRLLGIAFQLQDDYLDAFGDPATFGKQVGGDIIENKKTYLYLKALELGKDDQKKQLNHIFSVKLEDSTEKISAVKELFEDTGAKDITRSAIREYTQQAFDMLDTLSLDQEKKELLKSFGDSLMNRNY